MRNLVSSIVFAIVFVAAPAVAQQRLAAPVGVRSEDTDSYVASANASLRAVALCSGLWSGGQTRELIERRILPPAGDLKTEIDESRRDRAGELLRDHAAAHRGLAQRARLRAAARGRNAGRRQIPAAGFAAP